MFKFLLKISRIVPGISKVMKLLYCFDCPRRTKIGKNVTFLHNGIGCVIHPKTIIEDNVKIQHHVTIGVNREGGISPHIKRNCSIGTYAIIIGEITIGENCTIGAGCIVTKDIPDNTICYNKVDLVIKQKENSLK